MPLTRRHMLGLSLAAAISPLSKPALAQRFVNETGLTAGQFIWEPSRPDSGAVTILASRLEKLVHVYKDGTLIGISTCDMGHGQRTPMGIFTLNGPAETGEDEDGRDLAWTATALHAVNLNVRSPDHVRVPTPFARLLNTVALPGSLLVITDRHTQPDMSVEARNLLPLEHVNESARRSRLAPRAFDLTSRDDTVAVFISRADQQATLLRNGMAESHTAITVRQPRNALGTHVFALLGIDEDGQNLRWLGFGLGRSNHEPHMSEWLGNAALDRISIPDREAAATFAGALHSGATLIVTDAPGGSNWRSPSRDVVVLGGAEAAVTRNGLRGTNHARRAPTKRHLWANAYPDSGT